MNYISQFSVSESEIIVTFEDGQQRTLYPEKDLRFTALLPKEWQGLVTICPDKTGLLIGNRIGFPADVIYYL